MDTLLTDPFRRAHEAACGRTFAEFEAVRPDGEYHRLERGEIAEADYWRSLVDSGLDWDINKFHRVRRAGYTWIEGMQTLVAACAAGNQVVIGSNYPDWIEEVVRDHLGWLDLQVFASYQVGVRKPAYRFFKLLSDQAGVQVRDLVLVDDKRVNTDAVAALGGVGVHFTSAARTRETLRWAGVTGV
jgi:putative hydrolase of the HAD superfamily